MVLLIANRARCAKSADMPRADAEQIDAAYVEMCENPYSGDNQIPQRHGSGSAPQGRRVGASYLMLMDDRRIVVVTET